MKTKKYKAMIEKHADMIDKAPFGMHRAAADLRSWVNETREPLPPLTVSHVAIFSRVPSLHDYAPLKQEPESDAAPSTPEALEHGMGNLTLVRRREPAFAATERKTAGKAAAKAATSRIRKERDVASAKLAEAEAEFKSTMLKFLTEVQGLLLFDANKVVKEAWARKQANIKKANAKPGARRPKITDSGEENSDAGPLVLEVEVR